MTHEEFPKLKADKFFPELPSPPTDQELVEQIKVQDARIEKLERHIQILYENISYMALTMRVHHNVIGTKKFEKTARRILTKEELEKLKT